MKKVLSMLLALVFLLAIQSASGEGVIVLSSPDADTQVAEGSLDDMQLNAQVDLGDRIYTITKADVSDEVVYEKDEDISSDDDSDIAAVWLQVFNFSNQEQVYFKDAKVVVTFESERGPFQFGGDIVQNFDNDRKWYRRDNFYEIAPLYNGSFVCYCRIPNYAVNNTGELKMEITEGQQTITYYFRH